ncbi:MAG: phosphatase PAP2 family protein [Actinobacteria bacterium]|jgi:membrane-associated phospholipid phosphatase|nr:phosphatase PAP2 family protein [Actinomycetota bacterium]
MPKVDARRAEMNRALKWSVALLCGFLLVTHQIIINGPLVHLDAIIANAHRPRLSDGLNDFLMLIDDLGLRGVTATVLLISAFLISRRFKSFRPLNLSILSLVSLNLVVGLAKLGFGRTKPRLNVDLLHFGGLSYPSGHAANALLTWGLLSYLIFRYTHKEPFEGMRLTWLVVLITSSVCVVSLFRNTHWLSDLIGGLFIGGALLVTVIAVDRFVPSQKQPS